MSRSLSDVQPDWVLAAVGSFGLRVVAIVIRSIVVRTACFKWVLKMLRRFLPGSIPRSLGRYLSRASRYQESPAIPTARLAAAITAKKVTQFQSQQTLLLLCSMLQLSFF